VVHGGHEHQESSRQRDMGGNPGTLVPNGFLGHLNKDFLALLKAILNRHIAVAGRQLLNRPGLFRGRLAAVVGLLFLAVDGTRVQEQLFEVRNGMLDIAHIQERGLFQVDIHERSLHSRQHPHHPALVDVATDPAIGSPFDVELRDLTIFNQGNPCFIEISVND